MKRSLGFACFGLIAGLTGARYGGDLSAVPLPGLGAHGAWYASRAAGVAAYLFLWLGLAGGLLMSSAWFDGIIGRARLLSIHQAASIAGITLGLGHALVLIPDGWTEFGLIDVLVPFGSYYERTNVAIGSLGLYLAAVVSFSFWFRGVMGIRAWRWLHRASFLSFVGALWHGLKVGTDSAEPWLMGIYISTSLAIVFWLVVRLTYVRAPRKRVQAGAAVV